MNWKTGEMEDVVLPAPEPVIDNTPPIVIKDFQYFAMIDNQVRKIFAEFEVQKCLPAVQMVLARAEVPDMALLDYPVEGYYYKSPQLKELFKKIRNIQMNKEVYSKVNPKEDVLVFLKDIYESDLFGTAPHAYPWPDSPLKRRWDILTYTMQDKRLFDEYAIHPWTIETVKKAVRVHYKRRPNLPELAVLIDDAVLMCAACETNSLGRMYAMLTGSYSMNAMYRNPKYVWEVSPEVEDLGREIVALYNEKMGVRSYMGDFAKRILVPSLDNLDSEHLDWTLEFPRVAHLGYLIETELNYFWIVDNWGRLTDLYQKEMLTTEQYRKQTMGPEYSWCTNVGITTGVGS